MAAGRGGSKIGQRFVFDDATARHILVLRFQFAPARQRLQPAQHIGLAAGQPQPQPGAFRIIGIGGGIRRARHFIVQPLAAAGTAQLVHHPGEQLGKMSDITDGIIDLAIV